MAGISTILHPLTEVKGRKICWNSQQAKFVNCSRNISPDKTYEEYIRGKTAIGYQKSDKLRIESSTLAACSTIFYLLIEVRGETKNCSNGQKAEFFTIHVSFLQIKQKRLFRGQAETGYQTIGNHLGQKFNHSLSFI